ncbi:hypothetical protein KDL45_17870, partial [bacterium]|nr:hypothetical protein [bacterium]
GVDVYVPGGADMEIGLDKLLAWRDAKNVPMLAANINDAETKEPLFEPYKIFERNGLKVAVIGLAGSKPYATTRANADYQTELRAQVRERAAKGQSPRLFARLRTEWAKAAKSGDNAKQKKLVRKMMGEADFGGKSGEEAREEPDVAPEPAYTGRKFRLADPVVAANRVIDEIGKKADLFVAVANVDEAEMEALRKNVPRLHFVVDGFRDSYGGRGGIERTERPHPLTVGHKGKYVGLVKIRVVDGETDEFVDMGARTRAVESLKRLERAWKRLEDRAEGNDPLTYYDKDSRYYRRAETMKRRIDELRAKASYSPEGKSYFEIDQLMLDKAYPADAALEARMHEVEGTGAVEAEGTS